MTYQYYLYGEQQTLPETPAYQAYFEPARTAVVCVDMHEGHLSDSPDCPCPAPRGVPLVEPIDAFHDAARDLGVRIIHVRTGLRPSGADDVNGIPSAWRLGFSAFVGGIPNIDQHAIEGSEWTRFRTRVEPQDETVTSKKRLSAFYPSDLDFLLRQLDVRTIALTGMMTDCCILSTAFEASNLNYRVITVNNLVAGTNDELEDAALKIMSLNTGLVMDSGELLRAWQATGPTGAGAAASSVAAAAAADQGQVPSLAGN
ncbi:isochorismatase [Intrasporangium chromatireducens Q5-1]|uniref:Isochorismatase n=1 Tax=Intrasporangium chromatireducens Q5-1 TaxID=584657 RepID=W9GPC3_9MICO|nr:isochorismatase family cysteine hydrolase [Intrasporangium chromatireducens]EWT06668.1 isochorismatase [Intrasporangium chromatireducens Q5-1]